LKDLTTQELAQELLRRQKARDSLLAFTEYTCPQWVTAPFHALICEYLEKLERGEIKKLAINAPPRHGKTELASRRFPAWVLGRHPEWQVISTSAGGEVSRDVGMNVRDIISDPIYANVFPETALRKDAAASSRWMTSKGGIYIAGSVGSMIVGRGANLGIIDDPHADPADVDSERMRNIVGNWYYGAFRTRLMPPYLQLMIMTRWHEDDLSGRLLPPDREWVQLDDDGWVFQAGDWTALKIQALKVDKNGVERGLGHVNFPDEYLIETRDTYIKNGAGRDWRAQYMQEPVAEDGTFIRREWFKERYQTPPDGLRVFMAADFAITEKSQSNNPDRTEIGVFGLSPDDKMYVLDWWSGQTTSDVWLDKLLDLADIWHPWTFFGEVGMIRRSTEPILQRRMRERSKHGGWVMRIEWMPTSGDKISRAQGFQQWAISHRVVLPTTAPWLDEWLSELCKVPNGRFWDKLDTCSNMFQAIDTTHPGTVIPKVDNVLDLRDYYPIAEEYPENSWKTM
jgi:predicted phage terminase large subunit-like protein